MDVVLFIMPQKIEKKRRNHMMESAKKYGILVVHQFTDAVTHIVTEIQTREHCFIDAKVWFRDGAVCRASEP